MRLRIGLVTGGLQFNGDSLKTGSLGGSETAFLCAARELAALGHQVTAWTVNDKPGRYDGVEYLPIQLFEQCLQNQTFDVLIASRWPEFLSKPSRAAVRILWLHDTLQDKMRLMGAVWQTDEVWLLSDYHIKDYCGDPQAEPGEENPKLPELHPHVWKTSNGVDMNLIEANRRPKVPGKVIYTSRPERGLLNLFSIVPELAKRIPNFKLHYANYSLQNMQLPQDVIECVQRCDAFAKQHPEWVVPLGHLTKEQLYQEVSSSQAMLYTCGFPEISAIALMEAQACGTPIVSTDDFAISETVENHKTGVLIKGNANTKEYLEQFLLKASRLLQNPQALEKYSAAGPASILARGYTWKQVAKSWEQHLLELVQKRHAANPDGTVRQLLYQGDVQAALKLAAGTSMLREAEEREEDVNLDREFDLGLVSEALSKAQPVFARLTALLTQSVQPPKTVLDVSRQHAPFGLFLAKNLPSVKVTIWHNAPELLTKLVESLGLTNVEVVGSVYGRTFDMVYDGTLDWQPDPVAQVKFLKGCLNEGGSFAFTTGYGPEGPRLAESKPQRLWNLDFSDFAKLFPGDAGELSATFMPGADIFSGHWIGVCKVADVSCLGRDWNLEERIQHRKLWTRPYQTLGLSMIVKNEEDNLSRCLKAVRRYVDKVVIADTGSTDGTLEIAKRYADEIRHVKFDNFGQARNESMEGIGTDWYLWLDADEVMLGAENMRKYLSSTVYRGFVLAQRHLMTDLHGTFDTPVRLLRNLPSHRFTGCIHEHCEATERGPYGNGIRPTLHAQDIDLAHYGYPSEAIRRKKCSNRNMELLIRDLREHPNREINKLLFQRDCLNIVKWSLSAGQQLKQGSLQHALLNTAVALQFRYFSDPKNKLYKMTDPMCQEALRIMAAHGLPFEDRKMPPFEIALGLAGAVGKPVDAENMKPSRRMFVDDDHFNAYMKWKLADLSVGLGAPEEKYDRKGPPPVKFLTDTDAAVELLKYGVGAF